MITWDVAADAASTILGLTASLAVGVLLGTITTLSRISRQDDRTARRSRHQRDPQDSRPRRSPPT